MPHSHSHEPRSFNRAFAVGVALNTGLVAGQVVFGFLANSLALLADAGHNLTDVLGLLLAWGAGYLARRKPTPRRTYGLRRASILAALLNALLLLLAVGAIAWEAVGRFARPEPVAAGTVIAVAAAGVVVNTASALLFLSGGRKDLNVRGAFLHLAADAAVSVGVAASGLAVRWTGWTWLDPATSLVIAVVITAGTWNLLRESINLSMDAVPAGVDLPGVRTFLAGLPGVTEVHDLHIWGMSTTETALTVHLVKPAAVVDDVWLAAVGGELHDKFGIDHATIQVENGETRQPCKLAPDEVV